MAQDYETYNGMHDEWGPAVRDADMARFNARIALLISGELQALGDEMIPADDDPDGGEHAILYPLDIPPFISSIALNPPARTPLVVIDYERHEEASPHPVYS